MKNSYLDLLKETFQDASIMNPEKVKRLAQETPKFFQEMQAKFFSKDPKLKEEAEQVLVEAKEMLETQMEKLLQLTGLTVEELTALAKDPKQITEEEQEALAEMKKSLSE